MNTDGIWNLPPQVVPDRTLPYPADQGSTHWDGCWRERGHHNCAVLQVDALTRERDAQYSSDPVVAFADHPLMAVNSELRARIRVLTQERDEARAALARQPQPSAALIYATKEPWTTMDREGT